MFLFRSYFLRSHIQTFHRHQRRKIFITIIPSQKHGYKYTRIHSHRISSIERIHPPALFFQRIEANHRYLRIHTTTGMYFPFPEPVDSGLIGRPTPGKNACCWRVAEKRRVSTAPLSTGVPSWIIGLRFSDRQSSETWPFTLGLSIAGRPPGKGNIDGPENLSPCLDFPSRYRPAQFAASTNRIRVARVVFFLEEKKKEKAQRRRAWKIAEKSRRELCSLGIFWYLWRFLRWFFVTPERERDLEWD